MTTTLPKGYSFAQVGLHWLIAGLVLFQLGFGESMTTVVDAAEEGTSVSALDQGLASAHFWIGLAILSLAVVRVVVRLLRTPGPAVEPTLATRAASIAHLLFYVLLFAVPVSGLLGYYAGDPWGNLHSWAKPLFIGLVLVHGGAALFHHFWLKDQTLTRMLVPERN